MSHQAIQKNIAFFVRDHFPSFYKEEGEDFIAFMEAYFEWLEQQNNAIFQARRLLEYRDIDETLDEFVQNFVEKYLYGVPDTTALQPVDEEDRKKFLIKHVFDVYRSKGTERGYKLLFRLLFNDDIEVDIPGDYILRASDAKYLLPAFLEVKPVDGLERIIGSRVIGSSSGATALVEGIRSIFINQREVVIIDISDVTDNFITGEFIFDIDGIFLTDATNAPIVTGSMTTFNIINGGENYTIGDNLTAQQNINGVGGTAVVANVADLIGAVTVSINDGGSGFKVAQSAQDDLGNPKSFLSSNVQIQKIGPIEDITINDGGTDYQVNDSITFACVNMDGSVGSGFAAEVSNVDSNGTITAITIDTQGLSYSSNGTFSITTANGTSANLEPVIPGSGFSFEIGGISNPENLTFSTDIIGANNSLGTPFPTLTIDASVYGFEADPNANLTNSTIGDALNSVTLQVGKISLLSNVSVGSGYVQGPLIKVEDQDISPLDELDLVEGGYKGRNANLTANASTVNNSVTEIRLVAAGIGYQEGDAITFNGVTNPTNINATINLGLQGTRQGGWSGTTGLLDPVNRIQDSYFYQEYSYNVKSKRALNKYKDIVKKVIHVSGVALFGTVESTDLNDQTAVVTAAELEQVQI